MSAYTADMLRKIIARSNLSESSKKLYLADVNRYLEFAGVDQRNWTTLKTEAFYQAMLDRGMKPQGANRVMAAIKLVGKWYAVQTGKGDFSKVMLAAKKKGPKRQEMTPAQAIALMETCRKNTPQDKRDFALLVVLLDTAMRRSSAVSMAWDQWLENPPRALVVAKRKEDLFAVPLSDTVLLAMEPWRAWCREHGLGETGPVFLPLRARPVSDPNGGATPTEGGMSEIALYNIIKTRAAAAKVDGIYPHTFRHSFANWRLAANVPLALISATTGHVLPNTGALGSYLDPSTLEIVRQSRKTTPPWLSEYVEKFVRR